MQHSACKLTVVMINTFSKVYLKGYTQDLRRNYKNVTHFGKVILFSHPTALIQKHMSTLHDSVCLAFRLPTNVSILSTYIIQNIEKRGIQLETRPARALRFFHFLSFFFHLLSFTLGFCNCFFILCLSASSSLIHSDHFSPPGIEMINPLWVSVHRNRSLYLVFFLTFLKLFGKYALYFRIKECSTKLKDMDDVYKVNTLQSKDWYTNIQITMRIWKPFSKWYKSQSCFIFLGGELNIKNTDLWIREFYIVTGVSHWKQIGLYYRIPEMK